MTFRNDKKRKNDISIYSPFPENQDGNQLEIIDTLEDPLISFAEDFEDKETYKEVRKIVEELPEMEKYIITMHFGFINDSIMTQDQITDILNISQSYVSKAIKKIKKNRNQIKKHSISKRSI